MKRGVVLVTKCVGVVYLRDSKASLFNRQLAYIGSNLRLSGNIN